MVHRKIRGLKSESMILSEAALEEFDARIEDGEAELLSLSRLLNALKRSVRSKMGPNTFQQADMIHYEQKIVGVQAELKALKKSRRDTVLHGYYRGE